MYRYRYTGTCAFLRLKHRKVQFFVSPYWMGLFFKNNKHPPAYFVPTPHTTMSFSKPTIEQDAAKARDEFVIAVWTGTLPQTIEHEMRSELTSVGNFYDDLLSLDNHTIRVHLIMHDFRIAESG